MKCYYSHEINDKLYLPQTHLLFISMETSYFYAPP